GPCGARHSITSRVASRLPLATAVFVEAEIRVRTQDDVIHDVDADHRRRGNQPTRHGDVLATWRWITRRMIVKQHDGRSTRDNRVAKDLPRIGAAGVD